MGCRSIRFIPRTTIDGKKTPDLAGSLHGVKIVCEVKTINISDREANRRYSGGVGSSSDALTPEFFKKFKSTLNQAKTQIDSYDSSNECRRIAFIVFNFDDSLGEYKTKYFGLIDEFLGKELAPGLEVVIYNQRTVFHIPVAINNAIVVNESD
jgi:hypothetical protein